MGMTLEEYAKNNPWTESEKGRQAVEETTCRIKENIRKLETIDEYKDSISQQIKQGNDLQYILYTALEAIGVLTDDTEWATELQKIINGIYEGLEQQSFITDNAAIAEKRLEKLKDDFTARAKRQMQKQIRDCQKLEKELQNALNALGVLEGQNEETEEETKEETER